MPRKTPVGHGKPPVSFHDEPVSDAAKSKYKEIISKAKSKARERPGDMTGTPRFDETSSSWDMPDAPAQISERTAQGLQAVAEATAAAQERDEDDEYGFETSSPIAAAKIQEEEPEEELTEDERLRNAIESRIAEKIDIGQYLMNGEVTQIVPIISKKLVVKFRTVSDLEEAYVDSEMAKEGDMTTRAFLRKSNEWALAFHIAEVNGVKWPPTLDGDGTVSDKAVDRRLRHVKKLSSPIFTLITKNLAWYLERVQESLNAEALGNG
jgi:hypothetical protein